MVASIVVTVKVKNTGAAKVRYQKGQELQGQVLLEWNEFAAVQWCAGPAKKKAPTDETSFPNNVKKPTLPIRYVSWLPQLFEL